MNRFINALLVFLLIPVMFFTIYVAFDLPVSFLKKIHITLTITNNGVVTHVDSTEFPYQAEIFLGLSLLVLIINVRRSLRRWMGMRIVSRQEKFKWNTEVSKARKKRVITYLLLETLAFAAVGIALFTLTAKAWMPAIAYGYVAIDNILFAIIGSTKNLYRVGLSSKALMVADREVLVLYFKGLRKVSIHQQTVYFDYIKDLQLSFPANCIPNEQREEFYKILEDQLDPDKVFISKKR